MFVITSSSTFQNPVARADTAVCDEHAAVGTPQPLRPESLVRIRLGVAGSEASIQLVERRRAETAVRRPAERTPSRPGDTRTTRAD